MLILTLLYDYEIYLILVISVESNTYVCLTTECLEIELCCIAHMGILYKCIIISAKEFMFSLFFLLIFYCSADLCKIWWNVRPWANKVLIHFWVIHFCGKCQQWTAVMNKALYILAYNSWPMRCRSKNLGLYFSIDHVESPL